MATEPHAAPHAAQQTGGAANVFQPLDVTQTTCCVVGAGPAGAILALLLARQNLPVLLLEEHGNFDRDFRGDTVHPSTLEILDSLGLAAGTLALPHTELHSLALDTADGPLTMADFRRLRTRYPYVALIPQKDFLEYLTAQAAQYPAFHMVMGARAEALIEEGGEVRGVRYRGLDGWHEVRATLTVGADGRFSRLRRLAGLVPISTSPPMDVLWFRVPRAPGEPAEGLGRIAGGHIAIAFNRGDQWQIAYVIPKGGYQQLRAAGLDALQRAVTELVPELADRMDTLREWKQIALLSVASDRLARWYCPGLLLIGDAAHTMSPVGGVGINYAIQDAVVTANLLSAPLRAGKVTTRDLAAVQRHRELPTRFIQALQTLLQREVLSEALQSREPFHLPCPVRLMLRLPGLRALPARLIGFGLWRVRVRVRAPRAT